MRRILQWLQCFLSSIAGRPSCTQTGHTRQPVLPEADRGRAPGAGRHTGMGRVCVIDQNGGSLQRLYNSTPHNITHHTPRHHTTLYFTTHHPTHHSTPFTEQYMNFANTVGTQALKMDIPNYSGPHTHAHKHLMCHHQCRRFTK